MRPNKQLVVVAISICLVGLCQAQRTESQPRPPFEHAFGTHGPQYSHWLTAKDPDLWLRAAHRMRVLNDTGAGWARQDFWWSVVEPEKGRFEWEDVDRAVDAYQKAGINLFVILCYGSAWADGKAPATDQDIADFGEYVYQMVNRYKGKVQAWEIWNEPNILPFWAPAPDPEIYTKLLREAYTRAKQADPNCYIVAGGLAGPDTKFMRRMFEYGAAGYFDAFSYHNYGQELDMTTEWPAVQEMRAILRGAGEGDKPIWHTENGFYTGRVGLSPSDQAARLVRYSLGLLALGVEKTFQLTINDWSDDPQFHDMSSYRGITHADYRLKPSYRAYQAMCSLLGTGRYVGQIRPQPGVTGLVFREGSGPVVALWRDWGEEASTLELNVGRPLLLTRDLFGNWQEHHSPNGIYELELGYEPLYLVDPGPKIVRQSAIDWPGTLHSQLPREEKVPLTLRMWNPWRQNLELCVYESPTRPKPLLTMMLPERRRSRTAFEVDASRWPIGKSELYWELTDRERNKVITRGYWPVEVASPITLSFAPMPMLDPDKPSLPVQLDYRGSQNSAANVSLKIGGETVAQESVQLTAGTDQQVKLELPTDALAAGELQNITIGLESEAVSLQVKNQRRLVKATTAPSSAKIDGKLDEWLSRPPSTRPDQMTWKYINAAVPPGPEDLTVTGWVSYDQRGLWVAVRVTDDSIVLPQSEAVWNWDSLQVGLDLGCDSPPEGGFDNNDLEIELAANDQQTWCYLGAWPVGWPREPLNEKLQGAVRIDREAGIVDYELLVPIEVVGTVTKLQQNDVLGFSIMVNDNDADGRAGWQEFTPGIGMGKEPHKFAWLWLR